MSGTREMRAAASITTSRSWDRPMLPECMTTNGSARPCARENAFRFGPGTIAEQSAQFGNDVDPAAGRRPCLDQPLAHRLAQRDDAVGRAHEKAIDALRARAFDRVAVEVLEQPRHLRKHVLERNTNSARRSGGPAQIRGQADDRRIGQRHDHVGPGEREPGIAGAERSSSGSCRTVPRNAASRTACRARG